MLASSAPTLLTYSYKKSYEVQILDSLEPPSAPTTSKASLYLGWEASTPWEQIDTGYLNWIEEQPGVMYYYTKAARVMRQMECNQDRAIIDKAI